MRHDGELSAPEEDSMKQELVERLRDLAEEVEQAEGGILFLPMDEKELADAVKAMVDGGTVPNKAIGKLLYYVADMAEE